VAAAVGACTSGSTSPMIVRRQDREFHNYPFAITANAGTLVSSSGHIANSCGVFGLFASCEAVRLGLSPAQEVVKDVIDCQKAHAADRSLRPVKDAPTCKYPRIDRVFVMSQFEDSLFDRFLTESLPRLVYHLDYVLSNYNVAIHFGSPENMLLSRRVLAYLSWLGLSSRIINGTVYADEAYMPREGGCQDASYNAWEIISQRETLIKLATHTPFKKPIHNDIVQRFIGYDFEAESGKPFVVFVRLAGKSSVFSEAVISEISSAIESQVAKSLPQYEYRVFPSLNVSSQFCPPCDIRLFARAALIIGIPGTDLSHMMFMKPGGVAVESVAVNIFDPRVAPVIGANARLSAVTGLHHYIVGIDADFKVEQFVQDIFTFHSKVSLWH
jgi:hypothetical protein